MRKIVLLLTIVLMVCATSCSQNNDISNPENPSTHNSISNSKKYKVLEYGMSDCVISGTRHTDDIKLSKNIYSRMPSGTQKTVSINSQSFEAEYVRSIDGIFYNSDVDTYIKMDDYAEISVNINKSTGNIDSYLCVVKNYVDAFDETQKKSQEECKLIAIEYFSEYANYDEYELIRTDSRRAGKFSVYDFHFVRVIDGVETLDGGRITVTEYGDIYSHRFNCLGEMKSAEVPTAQEIQIIDDCVDKKIETIYKDIQDKYEMSYEIYSKVLVRFRDGKYALQYTVDVTLKNSDTDTKEWSEGPIFYVYL